MKSNSDKKEHVSRYRQNTNSNSNALFSYASKAIVPSAQELELNSRSRSAKLRYAIRN
jgi:16S rRNA C1402 N4-methylase RsmH